MTAVLGTRSAEEEEHEPAPLHVIVTAIVSDAPRLAVDDAGALAVFERRLHADVCADRLRSVEAAEGIPLFDHVNVVAVWRSVVTDALVQAVGMDATGVAPEDAEWVSRRAALFEAGTFSAEDALEQAADLADRIVTGMARRYDQAIPREADS